MTSTTEDIKVEEKILTSFWMKPIPDRRFDWEAHRESYEPGWPCGHGRTEEEAIADLLMWEEFDNDG